jgi:hypothetical protein
MPEPKIVFNVSTGSDTQASGAGPATAIFGTGASLNATTSVNLIADNPDLSGVATDGSACLWVSTSSGRQFAKITGVNNTTKVVTVALAYGVTATGQTWAIGGKRATLDAASSRTLLSANGWRPGWECLLETDQTITSTLSISGPNAGNYAVFRSNTVGTSRRLTCTANTTAIQWDSAGFSELYVEDITLENTNATKTLANGISTTGSGSSRVLTLNRCILGHATNQLRIGLTTGARLINSAIQNCTSFATDTTQPIVAYGSVFRSNSNPVRINAGGNFFSRCLFHDQANENLLINNSGPGSLIVDCTFDSPSTDNFSTSNFGSGGWTVMFINCNFTKGGAFGIRTSQLSELPTVRAESCNFGSGGDANTSGNFTTAGSVLERNCIAVTPTYVSRSTANYGPGSAIVGQGFPKSPATIGNGVSVAASSIDIGAIQSAGGGGGVFDPLNHPLIN